MKNVYYKKFETFTDSSSIAEAARILVEKLVTSEKITLPATMPLKVHFGEKGNKTFIPPEYFVGIKDFLKKRNIETCYIETNVLYKGSRTETADHINTAREHGFTDLPIVIADDDGLDAYNEIEINKKHFKKCKIGKKFANYDGFIILAHFKGHTAAGFGGSVKQLAMGFASRGGKLHQHSDNTPIISKSKCTACGACVTKCPVKAIALDPKAKINSDACIGCAFCSSICPHSAIANDWSGINFLEKIAEYAYAAALNKTNIYINFAGSITSACDCVGHQMPVIAKDIGVLVSSDPIAIDKATFDLLEMNKHTKEFIKGKKALEYAQCLGLGTTVYNLIEI